MINRINLKECLKTDLHCHLDGSLSLEMMEKHLGRKIEKQEICVERSCSSLTEYLTKFEIPLRCLQIQDHLEEEAYHFMKSLSDEHMKYIEVRFAPMLSTHEGLTCRDVIESALRGLERGKIETGIDYNVISCAMRHFDMDKNMLMLDCALRFLGKGICAIDLAGDESLYPNELFQEARQKQMPFVLHSGETGNVENVRIAVEYGAKRIGHGLALIKDPDLMEEVAKKQIGIEMCPTSNLQTKAVRDYTEYPLDAFLNAGVKVSINTDNRTVSDTTLTGELELVRELYRDEGMIEQLLVHAADTALGSSETSTTGMWLI